MSVSADEVEAILHRVLDVRRSVKEDDHINQHLWVAKQMECEGENSKLCEWVKLQIEREQIRQERWKAFESSIIGGIALAFLGFLGWVGTLIWHSRDVP